MKEGLPINDHLFSLSLVAIRHIEFRKIGARAPPPTSFVFTFKKFELRFEYTNIFI